ncbi:low density lipoprotein receptor adapter protein 1-like [Saccoglossus kowalevskii]|uniref:Low density lipoprotein receptor adapter protein 1-like n=1 Tax=Saccoglossus kowalevskii TaxID=10224 RepID=A0ABM0N1G0_SACKO|nr:PREDICTED: low density lipoprotein receptor adapter protein 1-like [Saccoglossus kowalevskii]
MAFWRKRSQAFEPNPPETKYVVQYLGKMPANGKMGLECTMKPVETMYRTFKFNKGKNYQQVMIEITNKGIRIVEMSLTGTEVSKEQFVPIHKMSFGAADPVHTRMFAFVMKNEDIDDDNPWECHAFLCETSSVAKALTLYLVKAFQKAAEAWEAKHKKSRSKPKTLHITHEQGSLEHQVAEKRTLPAVSTVKITLNVENIEDYDRVGMDSSGKKQSNHVHNNRAFAAALAKRELPIGPDDSEKDNENAALRSKELPPTADSGDEKQELVAAFNLQVIGPSAATNSPSASKLRKQRSIDKNKDDTEHIHQEAKKGDNTHGQKETNENGTKNNPGASEPDEDMEEMDKTRKKSVRFSESDCTIPVPGWADDVVLGDDDVIATGGSKKSKSSKGLLNGIANLKFGKSSKK